MEARGQRLACRTSLLRGQGVETREDRGGVLVVTNAADSNANVIFGASFNASLGEDVLITLIATGLRTSESTDHRSTPPAAEELSAAAAAGESGSSDEVDLDVPSFARRKRQPTNRS